MESIIREFRRPDIRFCHSGQIDIMANVAKKLELKDGDIVDFAKSYDEYFIYIKKKRVETDTIGRYNGIVHKTNRRGAHFRLYNRKVCSFFLKTCGESTCVSLPVGELRTILGYGKALHIITRNILKNRHEKGN